MCAGLVVGCGIARADSIVGGSDLLSSADVTQLSTWLGEGSITLTNIYDKAVGDTALAFHFAVDGRGRTFTIVEVTHLRNSSTGKYEELSTPVRIGGYNPQSWAISGGYKLTPNVADQTAFIFNLDESVRRDQSNQWQTVNGSNVGPTFGAGFDIWVGSDLSNGFSQEYSYDDGGSCFRHRTSEPARGSSPTTMARSRFSRSAPVLPSPNTTTLGLFGLGAGALALRRRRRKLA